MRQLTKLICLVSICCFSQIAFAGDKGLMRLWWLNVGLGVGASKPASGLAGEISGNMLVTPHWLLMARSTGVVNASSNFLRSYSCIATGGTTCRVRSGNMGDLGALVGYVTRGGSSYTAFSAGLGYVNGLRVNEGNRKRVETIGIPIDLQTFWAPTGHFAYGLGAFANVNTKHSFAGITLSLQIGGYNESPLYGGY
jgi:hypothetical protein